MPILPSKAVTKRVDRDEEGEQASLLAEVVFALLPLLVIFFTSFALGHGLKGAFESPEWSFGSAVLIGQTLAKFIGGLARGGHARPGAAQLIVAVILVGGLAPVLMMLFQMLQHEEANTEASLWLKIAQVLWFALAASLYVILGEVAARWGQRD